MTKLTACGPGQLERGLNPLAATQCAPALRGGISLKVVAKNKTRSNTHE